MTYLAYTIGNKKGYDQCFDRLASGDIPDLKKIGRREDLNGEYYSGGCCWPTYIEAWNFIETNKEHIPYEAAIYGIILPNGWQEDTSDDTYDVERFYSLLVDADLVRVDEEGGVVAS